MDQAANRSTEDEREAARLRGIANRKLLRGKLPAEWPAMPEPPKAQPDYELVRVSRELVEKLLAQEPQPVVLSGLERHEDGTIELWFRTPEDPA